MPGRKTISTDDRGASVAVNHVLALGITAILISGLLLSAATLLRDQRANNAEPELRTIGNRIAAQIAEGERVVEGSGDSVTFFLDQPSRIGGSTYQVEVNPISGSNDCGNYDPPSPYTNDYCIVLDSNPVGEVYVPLHVDLPSSKFDLEVDGPGEFIVEVCADGSCSP